MEKSGFKLGLDGHLKEWIREQVHALARTALKSYQNNINFIDHDDNNIKPKTSGYLSPAAHRASKNTPWDMEEYEDLDTFKPWTWKPPEEEKHCIHEWVSYTGLNETFQYCRKCDEKKK